MGLIDSQQADFYTAAVDRKDRGRQFRMLISKSYLRLTVIAGLAISGLGIAAAQTGGAADNNNSVFAPTADSKVDMNFSPAQMRAAANQYLPTMEQSAQTIRRQLEQARESRDVVKVLCLNDKLNQVDVALRSTKDRIQSLSGAADRNEMERSRHEFTVIQVLRDRVRALSQEASQCIGEETGFIDEPKVRVEIDPAIPKQDPTIVPTEPVLPVGPVIGVPNPMSPTR